MSTDFLRTMTFTASQVAQIVRMNPETLRVWRRRKNVVLEGERKGWTRYTFNDVMLIAVYQKMTQYFCANSLAEMVSGELGRKFDDDWNEVLDINSTIFCLINYSEEPLQFRLDYARTLDELKSLLGEKADTSGQSPIYQIVDCSRLYQSTLNRMFDAKLEK